MLHRLLHLRIFLHHAQKHRAGRFFAVFQWTCQYCHIVVIADGFKPAYRDGIRYAAIQQTVSIDFHYFGNDRHGCRSADPFHFRIIRRFQTVIYRLTGMDIGAYHIEFHWICPESFDIEAVQCPRQCMVAEFRIEEITASQQRTQTAVAGIA